VAHHVVNAILVQKLIPHSVRGLVRISQVVKQDSEFGVVVKIV
jgi:hypothetical protein